MNEVLINIDKFLGENISLTGDTNLKLGELSLCQNAKITAEMKPRKREGYKQIFVPLSSKIQGQWSGLINGSFFHLFACNGHLYKSIAGVNTDLGTLADAKTNFFYFGSKVYIQNGVEYKSFDGTSLIDVVGYRPLVNISGSPAGVNATPLENINLLTNAKRMTLRSDGIDKDYLISTAEPITSIDFVKYLGNPLTLGVDYTQDLALKKITMTVLKPTCGVYDDVEIGWSDGVSTRSEVTGYTNAILFGGVNDTRVHIYGNGTNVITFSALANGIPSAEYFPVFNTSSIGSSQYPVTSIVKQNNRMIISTMQASFFSNYDFTNGIASFTVSPLNDKAGNIALGQGQLIRDNPFIINTSIKEIIPGAVRDENNVNNISTRIQPLLNEVDLKTAITFDYEELTEYWLCVGKRVFIYNYGNDTFYHYDLADIPTCFTVIDGILFMGTSTGAIMEWAEYKEIDAIPIYLTDNGGTIHTRAELGFIDGGVSYKRKFLNFGWVGLKPESKSMCYVEWTSDYDNSTEKELISYSLMDFGSMDFTNFSFLTNNNPQPFKVKLKAKKWVFFKLIITNDSNADTMTILNASLPVVIGGDAK